MVAAAHEFRRLCNDLEKDPPWSFFHIAYPNEDWQFDSEQEFFTEYRRSTYENSIYIIRGSSHHELHVRSGKASTEVQVMSPVRSNIDCVFEIFEKHLPTAEIRETRPEPATVFIGHGHSGAWRDLKDHLKDKHEYSVHAYEVGERAGHSVRDILEDMLEASTIALMVMTAEDAMVDGKFRTRQNVVHETGLFQGRLGFSRCIAVVEEGTEMFSNLDGVEQMRFEKGRITETFGDVLATLRREFPSG